MSKINKVSMKLKTIIRCMGRVVRLPVHISGSDTDI